VTLAYRAATLYASWSNSTTASPVYTSTDDGATWTALPSAPAVSRNYCPDLAFNSAGELVLANEVNRTVYKLPTAAASWTLVGNLNPATTYTDFAAGGTFIFGTGSTTSVQRAPIDAFAAADIRQRADGFGHESPHDGRRLGWQPGIRLPAQRHPGSHPPMDGCGHDIRRRHRRDYRGIESDSRDGATAQQQGLRHGR
jgi:hypothetical protein